MIIHIFISFLLLNKIYTKGESEFQSYMDFVLPLILESGKVSGKNITHIFLLKSGIIIPDLRIANPNKKKTSIAESYCKRVQPSKITIKHFPKHSIKNIK